MDLAEAGECPEKLIRRLCGELVAEAKALGWTGPPFDPEIIASLEDIAVEEAVGSIGADARVFPTSKGRLLIQYDTSSSRERQRFSIAHEIAHTRFPDCYERVRHRGADQDYDRVHAELEQLCNIGASEILMPHEAMLEHCGDEAPSAELAEILRLKFAVSREAMLRRLCDIAPGPIAVVVMSLRLKPTEQRMGGSLLPGFDGPRPRFRVDYVKASDSFRIHIPQHKSAPDGSVVYLADNDQFPSAVEQWEVRGSGAWRVQGMRLPPIPGQNAARAAALVTPE